MNDLPTTGGRWARDKKTGELTPLPDDDEAPAAAETPAEAETSAKSKGKA